MRDRVPPRRQAAICAEELAVARLQADLESFPDRLPFDGGIEPAWQSLEDFLPRHSQKERHVGGRQVFTITALHPQHVGAVFYDLQRPSRVPDRAVAVLADGLFVVLG